MKSRGNCGTSIWCPTDVETAPAEGLMTDLIFDDPLTGGSEVPAPFHGEFHKPGKIICIGRNYREHAKELGNEVPTEPLFFLKPSTSIIRDGDAIVLPRQSERVEFEGEIAVVIGSRLKNASEQDALAAVSGIVALNDVTA